MHEDNFIVHWKTLGKPNKWIGISCLCVNEWIKEWVSHVCLQEDTIW